MYTPEFQAYKQIVTEIFLRKQEEEPHQDWLMNPTRVKIRQRCLELAERGLEPRDTAALRNYLSMKPGDTDYFAAFEKRDAETFKSVENFLANTDIKTAEKNIELLAWLIDYPHRPITAFKAMRQEGRLQEEEKGGSKKMALIAITDPTVDVDPTAEPQPEEKNEENGSSTRKVPVKMIGAMTLLLVGAVFIWSSFSKDECMYWDNDHYVASACSVPRMDTPMVAMDHSRLKGFRRIGKVDTLTPYAIGRLWFVRVGDKMEIYTGGGRHPLYPDKQLKKVTDYAVNVCRNQH